MGNKQVFETSLGNCGYLRKGVYALVWTHTGGHSASCAFIGGGNPNIWFPTVALDNVCSTGTGPLLGRSSVPAFQVVFKPSRQQQSENDGEACCITYDDEDI